MEEQVGAFWHRWITRTANHRYPEAAVSLDAIKKQLGILFRALGGDGGLKVEASYATDHFGHRSLLQKIAGSDKRVHSAWRDERALLLPPTIDLFPTEEQNRDLYLWLSMLAATSIEHHNQHWVEQNRLNTLQTLERFPGFHGRYRALAEAVVAQRPPVEKLDSEQRAIEDKVVEILLTPEEASPYPESWFGPDSPVPLWLVLPPATAALPQEEAAPASSNENENSHQRNQQENKRRKAERTENPDGKSGLIAMRMETIFSLAEYVKVDRTTDDDEDDNAESRAEDLDHLSITRDGETAKTRIKFDLDLPAAEYDDAPLSEGILYPEWNFKHHELQRDHCSVIPLLSSKAEPCSLPEKLRMPARKVRRQFEALIPTRTWFRGEMEGAELDLDAYIAFSADQLGAHSGAEPALYRDFRSGSRDLTTLLLADLSLSTDSWINNHARVIDVIRETASPSTVSPHAIGIMCGYIRSRPSRSPSATPPGGALRRSNPATTLAWGRQFATPPPSSSGNRPTAASCYC